MKAHPVGSLLTDRELLTAAPHTNVLFAARAMADAHVGSILILDGDKLVGIFTERDLLVRVVAADLNPRNTQLAVVMTADPVVIESGKPLFDAIRLMDENGFRHLPVIDKGELIGLVSIGDVVKSKSTLHDVEIQYLNDYIEGKYPG